MVTVRDSENANVVRIYPLTGGDVSIDQPHLSVDYTNHGTVSLVNFEGLQMTVRTLDQLARAFELAVLILTLGGPDLRLEYVTDGPKTRPHR